MNPGMPGRSAADEAVLRPLLAELDLWQAAGKTAVFWLRDDDAVADTPQLRRLLELLKNAAAPLLLAVIPLRLDASLPLLLADWPGVTPAVHGAWHQNHAPPSRKSEEMALERGETEIRDALVEARARMVMSFGDAAGVWYVPPWNRLSRKVACWLPELGFAALSGFGPISAERIAGLVEVNTDVDIIDWRGGRIGRPLPWLVSELVRVLAVQRGLPRPSMIGLLSHHLVHDRVAWANLECIMGAISAHSATRWADPFELARQ